MWSPTGIEPVLSKGSCTACLQRRVIKVVAPAAVKDELVLVAPGEQLPLGAVRSCRAVPLQLHFLFPPHVQPRCLQLMRGQACCRNLLPFTLSSMPVFEGAGSSF